MPKDKESRLLNLKRRGAFKINPTRNTLTDQASVELVTPVTSDLDEAQPSASSTVALPSNSPPASLSTSFLPIRVEQQQLTVPLLTLLQPEWSRSRGPSIRAMRSGGGIPNPADADAYPRGKQPFLGCYETIRSPGASRIVTTGFRHDRREVAARSLDLDDTQRVAPR